MATNPTHKSVGWLTNDGRWSGVGSALNWIDERVAVVGDDPVVAAAAATLPAEPDVVTVVGPRDGRDGRRLMEAVLPIAVPPGRRARVAAAGAGDPERGPAGRLARELGSTIIAPRGDVVLVPGGTLFAPGGWLSHDAQGQASPAGRRVPRPDWEDDVDALWRAGDLVVLPVPAGLWIFEDVPGMPAPELSDPAYSVPADARPVLLVGRPGHPEPSVDDVLAVVADLSAELRAQLIVAAYGPVAGVADVAVILAGEVGAPIYVSPGLPVLTPDDRMVSLAAGWFEGEWWETPAACLSFSPAGLAEPIGPAGGLDYPLAGERLFRLGRQWVAEVVACGLWVRRPEDESGAEEVRAYPWDPAVLRVVVGVPGEPPGDEVLPVLETLAGKLGAAARRQLVVEPELFADMADADADADAGDEDDDPLGRIQRAVVLSLAPGDAPPMPAPAETPSAEAEPTRTLPAPTRKREIEVVPADADTTELPVEVLAVRPVRRLEPSPVIAGTPFPPVRRRSSPALSAVAVVAVMGVTGFALSRYWPGADATEPGSGQAGPAAIATSSADLPLDPAAALPPASVPGSTVRPTLAAGGATGTPRTPAPAPPTTGAAAAAPKPGAPARPGPAPTGTTGSSAPTRPATPVGTTAPGKPAPPAGAPNTTGRNLALGATVTASSIEPTGAFPAADAVDGNTASRWGSTFQSDPQWLAVDLGKAWEVSAVRVRWESAYAIAYRVEVSLDGARWQSVHSTRAGRGGVVDIDVDDVAARHVRVVGTTRAAETYGYSIYELEVR